LEVEVVQDRRDPCRGVLDEHEVLRASPETRSEDAEDGAKAIWHLVHERDWVCFERVLELTARAKDGARCAAVGAMVELHHTLVQGEGGAEFVSEGGHEAPEMWGAVVTRLLASDAPREGFR
jgi:hypothetical protein